MTADLTSKVVTCTMCAGLILIGVVACMVLVVG